MSADIIVLFVHRYIESGAAFLGAISKTALRPFVYHDGPLYDKGYAHAFLESYFLTMIYFVTYGDDKYVNSRQRILMEAKHFGAFDDYMLFTNEDKFIAANKSKAFLDVLNQSRGGGYWLWKPVIIKQALGKINENDILVYCDCGGTINTNGRSRFEQYIEVLVSIKPIVRFFIARNPSDPRFTEEEWTNTMVLETLNVLTDRTFLSSKQLMATCFLLRKCAETLAVTDLWYKLALEAPDLFSDKYNMYKKSPVFKDHRHDQSVFSVINKLNSKSSIFLDNESILGFLNPFHSTRIRD